MTPPRPVGPLPLARSLARVSPEYVRVSMASAIALRLRSGRFSRDLKPRGINLLLNYANGCRSDCAYCGLARTRTAGNEGRSFIRVQWPLVRTDDLVERAARAEPPVARLCISMVTHGRSFRDTCDIAGRVVQGAGAPVSVLVAPPMLERPRLENLRAIGVDMIGIGLDAATQQLFGFTRSDVPAGGLSWDKYWEVIADAREIFGPWKVNVHVVVGLGEADQDLLSLFVALRDRQIFSYLFCFNPEPGSRLADRPSPSLRRWRRVQLARHLIESGGYGLDHFGFDEAGAIAFVRAERGAVEAAADEGTAFMTNGCPAADGRPGCTRPYGSYRPSEPFRDYPFAPSPSDLAEIREQLCLDEVVY